MILCITIYEMFKDKLKNLVVPEVTTEPRPRKVETGNYEEFAEDEETFVDELGLEQTSDEIVNLVGGEVKLKFEDGVIKLINTSGCSGGLARS